MKNKGHLGKEHGSRKARVPKALAVARLVDVVSRFTTDKWAGHYCTESYGDAHPTDEFTEFFKEMEEAIKPFAPEPEPNDYKP